MHPDDIELKEKKLTGQLDYTQPIIERLKGTNGIYLTFEEYATPIYENGEFVAIQGVVRNIDEKIKLEQDLQYRVMHDSLTDMYNRNYFEQQMQKYCTEINCPVAIVSCDVDGLKQVNDTKGHVEGDKMIQSAATMLKQYFGEHGDVARIGGDEFAVILTNCDEVIVANLCAAFDEFLSAYNLEHDLQLSVSVGYAYSNHSFKDMEKLFAQADQQMYKQKRAKYEAV